MWVCVYVCACTCVCMFTYLFSHLSNFLRLELQMARIMDLFSMAWGQIRTNPLKVSRTRLAASYLAFLAPSYVCFDP